MTSIQAETTTDAEDLWKAVQYLEERLERLEAQKAATKQRNALLMREMGCQLLNKLSRTYLARKAGLPALLPHQVRDMTFDYLEAQKLDGRAYNTFLKNHRSIKPTVGLLKEWRNPGWGGRAHHRITIPDSAGLLHGPVTEQDLRHIIGEEFGDTIYKDDVEDALRGLAYLAQVLQEPVFVSTQPPS